MILYEPFAGSAALTLKILGSKKNLMPYQGSKWRYTAPIIETMVSNAEWPESFYLNDAGPWGVTLNRILSKDKERILTRLKEYVHQDPRTVYDTLHRGKTPESIVEYAVQHLLLQRWSFKGKPIQDRAGIWVSPGYGKAPAEGVPERFKDGKKVFGEVRPQLPSLIRALEEFEVPDLPITVTQSYVDLLWVDRIERGSIVYLDPPYINTTGYPGATFSRESLIAFAMACQEKDCFVMISEGEEISELGWSSIPISKKARRTGFRGGRTEILTYNA